ncbi:MAG: hypothetical protein FWD53_00110 [Phycisphaerales bacterium]|nr:hypothetical protein [Phycisphaerales bacterium]
MTRNEILDPYSVRLELPRIGLDGQILLTLGVGLLFIAGGSFFAWLLLVNPPRDLPRAVAIIVACGLAIPATLFGLYAIILGFLYAIARITFIAGPNGLTIISAALGFKRHRHFEHATLRDIRLDTQPGNPESLSIAHLVARLVTGKDKKILVNRRDIPEMTRLVDALRVSLWPPATNLANPRSLEIPVPSTFTCAVENQNIRIHMNSSPVTQVLDGLYKIGLAFAIGMPFMGIVIATILYLEGPRNFETKVLVYFFLAGVVLVLTTAGIAVCKWARRIANQQADFLITPETLSIATTNSDGLPSKQLSWPRDQIASITTGPTDFRSGQSKASMRPTLQLNIRFHSGQTTSLFKHRDASDLRWLAETLHSALALPTVAETRTAVIQSITAPAAVVKHDTFASDLLAAIDNRLQNSNIRRIMHSDGSFVLQVDPLNWKRAAPIAPVLVFVTIFALFLLLFGSLGVLFPPKNGGESMPISVSLAFYFVSLSMLAGSFFFVRHRARKTAQIKITPTDLTITAGHESLRIPCTAITAVEIISHKSNPESLQFLLNDGSTKIALSFLTKKELTLLTSTLQLILDLP